MPGAETSARISKARVSSIFAEGKELVFQDTLAIEEPLEICIGFRDDQKLVHRTISITMRTPGEDVELAVGFLFSEGLLQARSQIASIKVCSKNAVVINLRDNFPIKLDLFERSFYTSSSCGLCGKRSLRSLNLEKMEKLKGGYPSFFYRNVYKLPNALSRSQFMFNQTGGIHAAGLFDVDGNLLRLREDVGRHNAVDKLIGSYFLEDKLPLDDKVLFLSGRASFELIQKALRARVPIVCAVGAPSSLAVETASEFGITLFGFVREGRFNLYTDYDRLRK